VAEWFKATVPWGPSSKMRKFEAVIYDT